MNKLPDYKSQLGRHGHNLSHDFSFTSGTGHLLTLMSYIMYPNDTIQGKCDMFTRTQPLLNPANCEIDEYIDYFFVPFDMLMSGLGELIYQVNEPYSAITKSNIEKIAAAGNTLPVINYQDLIDELDMFDNIPQSTTTYKVKAQSDYYGKDWKFFSVYRNLFHNYFNPNGVFHSLKLGLSSGDADIVWPIDDYQPNVMPLTMMAYNCVYEHFYRIDDREDFKPYLYNIDKDVYDNTDLFKTHADEFFSLKYRPKHFDYFTSANVRPFVNSSNLLNGGMNLTQVNNYLYSSGIIPATDDGTSVNNNLNNAFNLRQSVLNQNTSAANTAGIRSIFAVEKLLQITNRAKKTYDAQVMAHLGVKVPHDVKHEIIKIGTQHSVIKIGEVVSTAGTTDTPLGDIAGKGYGVMNNDGIKFTAPVHGIFIAIYSAVPKFRYYSPLPKHAQISTLLDFHIPEYEKLGMQPIFGYEGTPLYTAPSAGTSPTPDLGRVGWQMRYEQYKRLYNRVSPAFVDTIVQSQSAGDTYSGTTIQSFNGWHNWTVVRRPLEIFRVPNTNFLANRLTLDTCLCGAAELNGLMAVDYLDADAWAFYIGTNPTFVFLDNKTTTSSAQRSFIWNIAQLFYRDPLLHFCKPDFKVVNKMVDNTLPDMFC